MELLGVLILWCVFGLIGGALAKYKNRSIILWSVLSAIFLIIPIIILIFLPKASLVNGEANNRPLPLKKIAYAVVLVVIAIGYGLYLESKKDAMALTAKANLIDSCNSDSGCLGMIEANFDRCVSENLSIVKTGRKSRDVVLDNEKLKLCIGL